MAELMDAIRDYRSWPSNFAYNSQAMADQMDLKMIVRIVTIVGTYCILRPYIVKFFAWTAMKNPESQAALDAGMKGRAGANDFRDVVRRDNLEKSKKAEAAAKGDESSGEGEVTGADWGKKARKRQQKVTDRKEREEEIKRKVENGEADDKDVMDLLVDYEEGEEGW